MLLAICIVWLVERQLTSQFDQALSDRANNLSHLVERDGTQIDFEWQSLISEVDPQWEENVVCRRGNDVLYSHPANSSLPDLSGSNGSVNIAKRPIDGKPFHVATLTFQPKQEGQTTSPEDLVVTLQVARSTSGIDATISVIRSVIIAGSAISIVLLLLLTFWSVTRGLRPIDQVTTKLSQIDPYELDAAPLRGIQLPAELKPLVSTIDDLMMRLQIAFDRERNISGEMAHEMKTPLAGVIARCDVILSRERDVGELTESLTACRAIARNAATMVETLLATMPIDTCAEKELQIVQLSHEIESAVVEMDPRWSQRSLVVEHDIQPGVSIRGSQARVQIILRNLLDNAASYADPCGTVRVALAQMDNEAIFTLANTCENFPAKMIDRVFERFWRADTARSETEYHSGLGLSLIRRLAQSDDARINARYVRPWFEIVVRWKVTNEKKSDTFPRYKQNAD